MVKAAEQTCELEKKASILAVIWGHFSLIEQLGHSIQFREWLNYMEVSGLFTSFFPPWIQWFPKAASTMLSPGHSRPFVPEAFYCGTKKSMVTAIFPPFFACLKFSLPDWQDTQPWCTVGSPSSCWSDPLFVSCTGRWIFWEVVQSRAASWVSGLCPFPARDDGCALGLVDICPQTIKINRLGFSVFWWEI